MRVLADLNVLMDVFAKRTPHYAASAQVLSLGIEDRIELIIPGHAPTTIHYLVARSAGRQKADEALDWMLKTFDVVPATRDVYLRARAMGFPDYEDAVVTAMAEVSNCDYIVTRNVADFTASGIPVLEPVRFIAEVIRNR